MEVNNKYNEVPSLTQLSVLQKMLKSNGKEMTLDELEGMTLKQYKFIIYLFYQENWDKIEEILNNLK